MRDYATTTPWLNRTASLTEYGARGVPNVYLTRAYMSTGSDWNGSHYNNPEFDSLAKTYLAASELAAQRKATKRMNGLLLRDTPVITDYFISYVTASSSKVKNYVPEGLSHMRLAKVSLGLIASRRVGGGGRDPPPALARSTHALTRFLLKRIGLALITLILLSVIVFAVSSILPGNVGTGGSRAVRIAGVDRRAQRSSSEPTGLSLTQYWDWASGAVRGDLGESLTKQVPAWDLLRPALVQLVQARTRRLPHLRPALAPRRRDRRPALRQGDRQGHHNGRACRSRRCRTS